MSYPKQVNNNPRTNAELLKGTKWEKCRCAECRGTAKKTQYYRDWHGSVRRMEAK